jgi:KUP system potassium uptake protein
MNTLYEIQLSSVRSRMVFLFGESFHCEGNIIVPSNKSSCLDSKLINSVYTYHAYNVKQDNWIRTLRLAFQCIGVIYGDIGTSPLYVYASTFTSGISNIDDLYGVLSLILYSIILLPMIKYVFIVLYANDNGDGKFLYK